MSKYIDKTYIGNDAPSNRHVLWIDISLETPILKSYLNGKWRQVSGANAFKLVDTEEYPTLNDFLASDGEQGVIYLYPNGTLSDYNRYNEYIWVNDIIRYELLNEDISGKADKVKDAVEGNFAGIDSSGNLIDSGKTASDFATAEQGTKAEAAKNKADNAVSFAESQTLTDTQRNTALANVSNQTANSTTGKMGYKVLDPTKTFAEQVTAENTIYEVRDVFEISSNFTMPTGCTLKFMGGKLTGSSTLTFSNTIIQGNANIACEFAGTINGCVALEWFGIKKGDSSFDNGPLINKVLGAFKNVSSDVGTIYFSTPIIANNVVFAYLNSVYAFNGTFGNKSAITFNNSGVSSPNSCPQYYIGRLTNASSGSTNYRLIDETYLLSGEDENTTILTGITFNGVNNSSIEIGSVAYFNENVRIGDTLGIGNCYNTYKIGSSFNSNVHVRLYHNYSGWVNGDNIRILRATNSYSSFSDGNGHYYSCAVAAVGANASADDNHGYSNHVFEQCSMEGFDYYCMLMRRASSIELNGGRGETSSSNFVGVIKCISTYSYPVVSNFYANRGKVVTYDDSVTQVNVSNFAKTVIFSMTTQKILEHLHPFNPSNMSQSYNFCFDNDIELRNRGYKGTNFTNAIGLNCTGLTPNVDSNGNLSLKNNNNLNFVLNTKYFKQFYIQTLKCRNYIRILYLEDASGNVIPKSSSEQIAYGKPLSNMQMDWDTNINGFGASFGSGVKNYNFSLIIPSNVGKVMVGVDSCNYTVYGSGQSNTFVDYINTIGTTSQRPKANISQESSGRFLFNNTARVYAGFEYFDTDLNKYVIFDGSGWKDSDAIRIATSQPSGGMLPNTQYNFGTLDASITFSLATPADTTVMNVYYWAFTTPASMSGITVTMPSGITWADGTGPTITAGKYYEIMVCNGIGTYMEV